MVASGIFGGDDRTVETIFIVVVFLYFDTPAAAAVVAVLSSDNVVFGSIGVNVRKRFP